MSPRADPRDARANRSASRLPATRDPAAACRRTRARHGAAAHALGSLLLVLAASCSWAQSLPASGSARASIVAVPPAPLPAADSVPTVEALPSAPAQPPTLEFATPGAIDAIAPPPSAPEPAATVRGATSPLVAEALAYEHGEGVTKDPRKAAALYCQAARAGDPEGLFALGWMYANGRGIPRDYDIAASLFTRAAAFGHVQAAKVLPLFRQGQVSLPECLREDAAVAQAVPFDIVRAEVDPFAELPAYKQRIADVVNTVAPAYGIEPRLALAVIAVESNFDHLARSEKDARGLMQLIPETAARFKVRNAYDIRDNVRGGLSYLRWLLAYYRGDVRLAAAAYNAGEGAVDRYRGVPPYAETRDYVQRVMNLFRRERHPFDPTIVDPSPALASVGRRPQESP